MTSAPLKTIKVWESGESVYDSQMSLRLQMSRTNLRTPLTTTETKMSRPSPTSHFIDKSPYPAPVCGLPRRGRRGGRAGPWAVCPAGRGSLPCGTGWGGGGSAEGASRAGTATPRVLGVTLAANPAPSPLGGPLWDKPVSSGEVLGRSETGAGVIDSKVGYT